MSRREVVPFSGFSTPILFNNEITNFFAHANVGPLIVEQDGVLQPTAELLNAVLFFTQPTLNGQRNPLYGVATISMLTKLLGLHAFYSGLSDPDDLRYIQASRAMRELLPRTIAATIQKDLERNAPETFNPDRFGFVKLTKLISAGQLQKLTMEDLERLTPAITKSYQPLFPNARVITPGMVLQYQDDQIELARNYKNDLHAGTRKTVKTAERLAQAPLKEMTGLNQTEANRIAWAQQILRDPSLTAEQVDELLRGFYAQ